MTQQVRPWTIWPGQQAEVMSLIPVLHSDTDIERDSFHVQGKVSIMAHSLGSVLTYDILCNQPDLYSALNVRPLSASPRQPTEQRPGKPFQFTAMLCMRLYFQCGSVHYVGTIHDIAS